MSPRHFHAREQPSYFLQRLFFFTSYWYTLILLYFNKMFLSITCSKYNQKTSNSNNQWIPRMPTAGLSIFFIIMKHFVSPVCQTAQHSSKQLHTHTHIHTQNTQTHTHTSTSLRVQLVTLCGRSMMVFSSLLTSTVFTRGFEVCSAARTLRSPVNDHCLHQRNNNIT